VALSRLGYLGEAAMSVAAIVGALAVMLLILWVSGRVKGNVTLLIIGVMIGYLANAIIGVLKYLSPEEDVKSFVVWGLGSFSRVSGDEMLLFVCLMCVLLPLACLLGLNGYDYQTDNLEDLEHHGWWACLIFPMASNIQFVFYRKSPRDSDVIFKILLNEQEATLPLPTDMAPYYHWRDFRNHYLKMLDDYEAVRGKQ
jgi:hypothetical protein